MKTILIILMSVTLSLGASAQRKGYYYAPRTHVYFAPFSYGFGYGYPYLGSPYFGSPYFGFPYYGYGYPYNRYRPMPYKLTRQIESIKTDYKYKIRTIRKDKTLSRSQRRQDIRALKSERDKDVINAERNFRRQGRGNPQGQNPEMNNGSKNQGPGVNNQPPENNNSNSDSSSGVN